MKILLVPLLLIVCSIVEAQKKPIPELTVNSFAKYSYQIVKFISKGNDSTKIQSVGTCFFIRQNNILFLVSAKHTFSGFSPFTLKPIANHPDTLGIVYYNIDKDMRMVYALPIDAIKKDMINTYFYKDPDVVVIKLLDDQISKYVLSIENFIYDYNDAEINFKKEEVFAFGYADNSSFNFGDPPHLYIGNIAEPEEIPSVANEFPDFFYFVKPITSKGMSGSPIFVKCTSQTKETKIIFGGLIFGVFKSKNLSFVVPAEMIKTLISRILDSE